MVAGIGARTLQIPAVPTNTVKIGTGILTDSIAIGRCPVRGSAWADKKDAESWVEEERDRKGKQNRKYKSGGGKEF